MVSVNKRLLYLFFFFFKQKTAYEMRISDWSSDVRSSDLAAAKAESQRQQALARMADVTERYIKVFTAARLLRWSIDRYREQKQGPMLARAGAIFSGLTSIGRASCRERVCQLRVELGGRRSIKNKKQQKRKTCHNTL